MACAFCGEGDGWIKACRISDGSHIRVCDPCWEILGAWLVVVPGDGVVTARCDGCGAYKGRVDRVDRTPEGLVFVDYKTTSSAPKPDLQLPIYREAAAPVLYPGEHVRDAYYYSLTKAERIRGRSLSTGELADVAEEARNNLEDGYLPPDRLQRVCAFCEFDLVCRRGPRLGRKGGEP